MTKEINNNVNRNFEENSWTEWSQHVFKELERFNKISSTQQNDLINILNRLVVIETKMESLIQNIQEGKGDLQEVNKRSNDSLERLIEQASISITKINNTNEDVEDLKSTVLSLNNIVAGEGESPGLKTRLIVLEDNQKKIQRIVFGAVLSIVTTAISAIAYFINTKIF